VGKAHQVRSTPPAGSTTRRSRLLAAGACTLAVGVAIAGAVAAPGDARGALDQSWPPFALIAGLLLVGVVAATDGLFDAVGGHVARAPGSPAVLFALLMGLVAVVTALLNLDTAVVFLTPVLVAAARNRRVPVAPFLYGAVFMANSASLLFPGSNLTNLLVLSTEHVSGGAFAARMLPAWLVAVTVTWGVMAMLHRDDLRADGGRPDAPPRPRVGVGVVAVVVALVLILTLTQPAPFVLGVGIAAAGTRLAQGRLVWGRVRRAVNPLLLAGLFALVLALGTLARVWSGPSGLVHTAGPWTTMSLGALGSVLLNNLPAAVLFSARPLAHPRALLLGLDVGPNLAITGSLAAILWLQIGRSLGERPSIRDYSLRGVCVAVPALILGLAALLVFGAAV
jgi:arsenical pump membrane protein